MKIEYKHNTLSSTGYEFEVVNMWHPIVDGWSPCYQDIRSTFNCMKYTAPRLPIDLGQFNTSNAAKCPNILRMPIKMAGSDVRLPVELQPMLKDIIRILQYDKFIMGDELWDNMFVHLTHHTEMVQPGHTLRYPGFHGDGFQGGKFKTKLLAEHSYIVTSPVPTVFAMKPFFVAHLNEDRCNVFEAFDQQIDDRTPLYQARPDHVYLVDPYMVHTSPAIQGDAVMRTFVRITTTPAELLMPYNTINPMFDGQVYEPRIDVRDFLSTPDHTVPLDFYGLQESPPLSLVAPASVWEGLK